MSNSHTKKIAELLRAKDPEQYDRVAAQLAELAAQAEEPDAQEERLAEEQEEREAEEREEWLAEKQERLEEELKEEQEEREAEEQAEREAETDN